jgi:hypothetical protein
MSYSARAATTRPMERTRMGQCGAHMGARRRIRHSSTGDRFARALAEVDHQHYRDDLPHCAGDVPLHAWSRGHRLPPPESSPRRLIVDRSWADSTVDSNQGEHRPGGPTGVQLSRSIKDLHGLSATNGAPRHARKARVGWRDRCFGTKRPRCRMPPRPTRSELEPPEGDGSGPRGACWRRWTADRTTVVIAGW